ncbi:SixA phosphatase family protein [Roseibium litorale]|uniref:SixA phosphatase family protein n=1 Tax=Roseibium litorale TaxID=2803841 RepID=UPI001FE7A31D|nr:histidine phosphatase family protein [Roseibium litorale]
MLRHAKSDWSDSSLKDVDRPLNARGQKSVPAIGRFMADNRLFPDLILCSTAQRTRETLAGIMPFLPREGEVRLLRALYDQSEDSYIPQIRKQGGTAHTLLVIGHNPATEETAHELFGSGPADLKADMEAKYPSGGLCVLDFDLEDWSKLIPETGQLIHFVKPRNLMSS